MTGPESITAVTDIADRGAGVVRCRLVRARLPGEVLGTWRLSDRSRAHLETCLACQAQAARYRAILRALRALRDDLEETPMWLVDQIALMIGQVPLDEPSRASRKLVAVSAVAASAVATAAVLALLKVRSAAT